MGGEPPTLLSSFTHMLADTRVFHAFSSAPEKEDGSAACRGDLVETKINLVESSSNSSRDCSVYPLVPENDTIARPRVSDSKTEAGQGGSTAGHNKAGAHGPSGSYTEMDMPELDRLERAVPLPQDESADETTEGSTSALRATSTSKTGNEASSLRLSGGANGAVSGKGRSWVRTGTSTSTASTFVPGLSPAPAIYGPETDRGHQSQTRGLEYMESPSVERQATVTGDGVGRGAGIVRWGRGNRTMTLNEQHHEQHQQQEQQRKSATSEAVTDANASTSEKDASSRNRPNAPAPLDLSSLAGPAPPFRRKADSNASSAASSVSKPVVLQGAALESLQRLGRQRSAGSGGGSACSIRKGKYGGAARAADPYGRRSSRGFMHKSRSNSSRLLSSGGMENGFRTFDDQVDVSEGCPKISEEGRTKAVPGMTPGSDDKKSCAFEVEGDSDDAPPPPSPMLTAHLREKQTNQLGGRAGRGNFKGRGVRPLTWTEDAGGQVGDAAPSSPPNNTSRNAAMGEAHMRLVRHPLAADDTGNNTNEVSPMGTPLSMASACTFRDTPSRTATATREEKPQLDTLARVTADIAKRGAVANADLLPGLGRSAFEHISFSPTIPVRVSAKKGLVGADIADSAGPEEKMAMKSLVIPRPVKVSSRAVLHMRASSSGESADSKLSGKKPHILGAHVARYGVFDDTSSSGSTRRPLSLEPPSLTVEHAPGRIYIPGHPQKQSPSVLARVADKGARTKHNPPFRLSSSKRLSSFDSRRSSVSPVSCDRAEYGGSANNARKYATAAGSLTIPPKSPLNGDAVAHRRPTTIDMLSTFGSHGSLSREELVVASQKVGHSRKQSLTSHPEEDDGLGKADGLKGKGYRRRSSSGDRRRNSRGDRISQRRSRSSGSNGGDTRRSGSYGGGATGLPGAGHDEDGRGRIRTPSRNRAGTDGRGEERDDPRGHRYPGTTPTSASSQHDEHIAHMPPMIVTPARQRRSHGRRYDLGKPTPTPTPTRPAEVERNGNPHTAAGSVVDSDDASGTTRRHSSKRRQHRRRSSAAPVADSATAIAFITDGGSERSGPERELPSSGALPNRVGIVPTSRRDSAVRRKGEIAEAAPQRRSASTSRAVAMRTEGCAGIDEQVSGENEQGKSVGRGGGGGGVVVGDEEQRALSHGVVARGEVQEGVFPNGTPAFLGEEGGAGDAPAMSRRRWSRGSKKAPVVPTTPRNNNAPARRTPTVQKKGKTRGLLRFASFFRGHKKADEDPVVVTAVSPATATPPEEFPTSDVGARSLSALSAQSCRKMSVVSTPVRSTCSGSFRGVHRSGSFELTPTAARGGSGASGNRGTGRSGPFFARWSHRLFTRHPNKRDADSGQRARAYSSSVDARDAHPRVGGGGKEGSGAARDDDDDGAGASGTVENSSSSGADERGAGGGMRLPFGTALPRVSLRMKSVAEERSSSSSAGGASGDGNVNGTGYNNGSASLLSASYDQLYDEPSSPAVMNTTEKRLSGRLQGRRDEPEGGARVQHLLRTSQLHMNPHPSALAQKTGSGSSDFSSGKLCPPTSLSAGAAMPLG